MNAKSLTRREFLTITAVMLEAAYLGWPMAAAAETQTGGQAPVDLSTLSVKIGEHYLGLYPAENNLPQLKRTLHFNSNATEEQIKAQLREDIHGDFAREEIFRYAGWVFSRTEGRLCAYKFLTIG